MAYDRMKLAVDVLNYAITKNRTLSGAEVDGTPTYLLAENMSNITELGTKIENLDADMLKSFEKDIAMGIARIEYIDRVYEADTFGIVKNNVDYNGAYQRLCMKSLPEVQESHARHLISGVNYFDGKFYGGEIDALIFKDEYDFKIPYSIGYEDIRAKFSNAEWVMTTIEQWRNAIKSTLEVKLSGAADDLVNRLITETISQGRQIKLITSFNAYYGYNGANAKTWTEIKTSDVLMKEFKAFITLVMGLIKGGFIKLTKKYNNGDVYTHTPSNKIKIIGLTEFVRSIDYLGTSGLVNASIIPLENIHEVLCWQSDGANMVNFIGGADSVVDKIKRGNLTIEDGIITAETGEDGTGSATTTSNVVAIMYDTDMLGVSAFMYEKVGVETVGAELFETYFNHYAMRQYLDLRGNSVAFTLD